jgi:hypothetical protein
VEALFDTQGVRIIQLKSRIAVCKSAGEAESKACEMGGIHAEFHIRDQAHFGDCEQGS